MVNVPTVLHVSEAFGGGLASAVQSKVAATPDFRHVLAYSARPEAPLSPEDFEPFDTIVTLPRWLPYARETIQRTIHDLSVSVVHAHSAIGGAASRLSLKSEQTPIVYTPHCFAHLREDKTWPQRQGYRLTERFLAKNTSVFAACSPYEFAEIAKIAPDKPRIYIPNVYAGPIKPTDSTLTHGIHVFGVGRLLPQKDPDFFVAAIEAARAAGIDVTATWIGDGDLELHERLVAADVEVTGWLPRSESRHRLAEPGSVYLHTARWEGFPFGILEAHAAGVPMIVRRIPTLADFDFPHAIDHPDEVAQALKELSTHSGRAESLASMNTVLADNNPTLQRERLLETYRIAMESVASR